jgi:hypothetical protein
VVVYFEQIFENMRESANYFATFFHRTKCVSILTEHALGYVLGDFFTNSSGHPARGRLRKKKPEKWSSDGFGKKSYFKKISRPKPSFSIERHPQTMRIKMRHCFDFPSSEQASFYFTPRGKKGSPGVKLAPSDELWLLGVKLACSHHHSRVESVHPWGDHFPRGQVRS